MEQKKRAEMNRTLTLDESDIPNLQKRVVTPDDLKNGADVLNKTINSKREDAIKYIPDSFADLVIIDPPYNLSKNFNGMKFNSMTNENYDDYLATWFPEVCKKLR